MGGAIDKGHQESAGGNQMKDMGSVLLKGLKGIGNVVDKGLQIADVVSGVLPGGISNKIHQVTQTALAVEGLGKQAYQVIKGNNQQGQQGPYHGAGSSSNPYISNPPENMGYNQTMTNYEKYGMPSGQKRNSEQYEQGGISGRGSGQTQFDGGSGGIKQRRYNNSEIGSMGTISQNLGEGRTMLQNKDIIRHSKTYLDNSTEMGLRPTSKVTYGEKKKQPVTEKTNLPPVPSREKRNKNTKF